MSGRTFKLTDFGMSSILKDSFSKKGGAQPLTSNGIG